jgi:hypothetical protein
MVGLFIFAHCGAERGSGKLGVSPCRKILKTERFLESELRALSSNEATPHSSKKIKKSPFKGDFFIFNFQLSNFNFQ